MKTRKIWNTVMMLVLLAALTVAGSTLAHAATKVTKAEAKQIALDYANVKKASVKKWIKVKLDNWDDDGTKEWDVEFTTSSYKYELEINSKTGRVEDYEKEKIRTSTSTGNSSTTKLTEAQAKKLALKAAGVTSADVKKWTKVKLDGNEWEFKFQTATYRFEVDIHARTGAVKDFEKKKLPTATGSTGGNTGLEKAKQTAIAHAKKQASVSNLTVTKAKQDYEHGRTVYEIELRSGWLEFEYEIDASTGQILEWDMDYDD